MFVSLARNSDDVSEVEFADENALRRVVSGVSSLAPTSRAYEGRLIKVDFVIHYEAFFGQEIALLGSHDAMGSWDEKKALRLHWSQGDHWCVSVDLPSGGVFFYKYLLKGSDNVTLRWQDGSNSMLVLPESWNVPTSSHYLVEDNFAGVPGEQTEASVNLLSTKLTDIQGEKLVLLDQLQMQKHMTQTALEELLLAREDLAQAQAKLLNTPVDDSYKKDFNGSTR